MGHTVSGNYLALSFQPQKQQSTILSVSVSVQLKGDSGLHLSCGLYLLTSGQEQEHWSKILFKGFFVFGVFFLVLKLH